MSELLTLSQAADIYNQNVRRMHYAASKGALVTRQEKKGAPIFVSIEAVETWIASTPEAIQEQYSDYLWLPDAAKMYVEADYQQIRYLILGKNNRNPLPHIEVKSSDSRYTYMIEREPFEAYAQKQGWTPNE